MELAMSTEASEESQALQHAMQHEMLQWLRTPTVEEQEGAGGGALTAEAQDGCAGRTEEEEKVMIPVTYTAASSPRQRAPLEGVDGEWWGGEVDGELEVEEEVLRWLDLALLVGGTEARARVHAMVGVISRHRFSKVLSIAPLYIVMSHGTDF